MAITLPQTHIKAFTTAPSNEQEISVTMNEEWLHDGACMTGTDRQLELTLRANTTCGDTTKI